MQRCPELPWCCHHANISPSQVEKWLERKGWGHLKDKLKGIDGANLLDMTKEELKVSTTITRCPYVGLTMKRHRVMIGLEDIMMNTICPLPL